MWTLFFFFEASKAIEQNNNGRGQTKRTSIIVHSQIRKCWQGQNTRQNWRSALVNYLADIYGIMYRHKHFKYGFKVWWVYVSLLLVWHYQPSILQIQTQIHLKFNIFMYVKTRQIKFCFKVCFLFFPLTGFEIMNARLYIRRSFYSFCYPLALTLVQRSSM